MIVDDKQTRIVVTLNAGRDVDVIHTRNDSQAFLDWWRERCREYKAPDWRPRGDDRRLAVQLVQRHGLDTLRRLGVTFWRSYSDPLISGEYRHHLRLFQARMGEVQRDLRDVQTTDIAG